MFALIDCNNFYASCERLFRPDLQDKPIIVLSNNDGCVIARSNEAKALGIPMGVPFFEMKALCKQHKISVFSSNYTLYGDISTRVMRVIQDNWHDLELYSIDEAFLNLAHMRSKEHTLFCDTLQQKILRHIGIPTSIGIGPTKTLAKVANFIAKRILQIPVFNITSHTEKWLPRVETKDLWGIGHQWQKKLASLGIKTAGDLSMQNPHWIRNQFNVVMQRIVMELNGIACLNLEESVPKQSIMSSCSFGTLQSDYKAIAEAISHHCTTAWGKLRAQHSTAEYIGVFLRSNPFRLDLTQYTNAIRFKLPHANDDLQNLTYYAKFALKYIFKPDIHYHKSGVFLEGLAPKTPYQLCLDNTLSPKDRDRIEKRMQTIELINHKFGPRTIGLAAQGTTKEWSMKRYLKSPHYTTNWDQLPTVAC